MWMVFLNTFITIPKELDEILTGAYNILEAIYAVSMDSLSNAYAILQEPVKSWMVLCELLKEI